MKFDPTVIVAVVALISSVGGIFLTNRYAARSARAAQESAEKQKAAAIDSESFKRARENYDAAIAEQERRLTRLRSEMESDREDHIREMVDFKRQMLELRADLTALREWSRPLLRAARAAGVQYPEPPVWLGGPDTGPNERIT